MKNVIDFENLGCKKIKSKIEEFGYLKITAMFESANYLFFDYELKEDMSNTMTVENAYGDILLICNLNCGYNGHGPRNTKDLLMALGIEEQEAERLMYLDGFQIIFEEGRYCKNEGTEGLVFDSRENTVRQGKIPWFHGQMIANLPKKQLYFIKPEGEVFLSLIDTLSLLEIRKMNYYIGNKNEEYYDFSLPYLPHNAQFRHVHSMQKVLSGPFVHFDATPFDVICFLGEDCPGTMINMLATYVVGYPVFREMRLGGQASLLEDTRADVTFSSKLRKLINYAKKPEDLYRSVEVRAKSRGRFNG